MWNLSSQIFDLTEDVLKRKWAGDFDGEIELIDAMLARDLPQFLKERLEFERDVALALPKQYPYTRKEALAKVRALIPDFTMDELDALELNRVSEYIYVRGEKRYHTSFLDTMLKVDVDCAHRAGRTQSDAASEVDKAIENMKREGVLAYRITMRETLKIDEQSFIPNAEVRCYLPIPKVCAQQSDITVRTDGAQIASDTAPQRTAYFQRHSSENLPFEVEFSYVNRCKYIDLYAGEKVDSVLYPNEPAPTDDDLSEQLPHIAFTPFLRALAAELRGDESDPLAIARRFYDYITQQIRYSYMRSYALIERQAEYCALSGKGDCGIQALLMIALCRISGIPARWQSGWEVNSKSAGCHDWAQIYLEPYGWVFIDPSYGGGAHRNGDEARRRFYFGNLEPMRMVANSRYQTPFIPLENWNRVDPYDNQEGEVSINGVGLQEGAFHTEFRTLKLERIE